MEENPIENTVEESPVIAEEIADVGTETEAEISTEEVASVE